MMIVTSVEARSRIGKLIDRVRGEPVEVTRCACTVVDVVSKLAMRELADAREQREEAVRCCAVYCQDLSHQADAGTSALREAEVNRLAHALHQAACQRGCQVFRRAQPNW